MGLSLPSGEPAVESWRVEPVNALAILLFDATDPGRGRPRVVAVDGRSGSGKSTLAEQLQAAVPASAVVHTDDVAWHHSFFDWAELLARDVLEPLRWQDKGRLGAIEVPGGLELVLIEGVGAGRRELTHLLDATIWVQSDAAEAQRRGTARDAAADGNPTDVTRFWQEWMAQELPFVAAQRPWERAAVVVRGTTTAAHDPEHVALGSTSDAGS
jgi:energy-coupling factor transporter ATP-binding protein EcfA2